MKYMTWSFLYDRDFAYGFHIGSQKAQSSEFDDLQFDLEFKSVGQKISINTELLDMPK